MEQKKQLQEFERRLDEELDALPSWKWSSVSALRIASALHEILACKSGPPGGGWVDRGYAILSSYFVAGSEGYEADITREADLRQIMNDLFFTSHHYMIREYLYYSYNVPGSMSWMFDGDRVEVRFADPSIPRQFFTVHNDHLLGSQHHFREFNHSDEIMRLLKDEPEGVITPNLEAAGPLMLEEVDLKLAAYFSLIASDSQIDLGGYTYQQFLSVYRMLLTKSLYHRYLARAQEAVGAIYMPNAELLDSVQQDLGIGPEITRLILKDIVYDSDATAGRVDASYFSLVRESEPEGRIVMRPHHFATAEGLVNVLRVIAQRRPNTFLDQVSNELGSAFVRRVRAAWEA